MAKKIKVAYDKDKEEVELSITLSTKPTARRQKFIEKIKAIRDKRKKRNG